MLLPILRRSCFFIALLVAMTSAAQTQSGSPPQNKADKQPTSPAATHNGTQSHSEGERIFVQNCARCHTPPDGFAPRISGTIVFHMRVRASLSEHDQQELLRYFNP